MYWRSCNLVKMNSWVSPQETILVAVTNEQVADSCTGKTIPFVTALTLNHEGELGFRRQEFRVQPYVAY